MDNDLKLATGSNVQSPPMEIRGFVLTRSGKFEADMKGLVDLPGVALKVSCLRSEIEMLPNPKPMKSIGVSIGSVKIEKPVIHGMLEQHQAQAVRFMEPASLIVIAFEGDPLTQKLAEQLEQLSGLLGINTLLFPMLGETPIALTPFRSSFSSLLYATSGDASKAWSQVLSAILLSVIGQGLICVDWDDIENIFDHSRRCSYHQINASNAGESIEALKVWCNSTFPDKKPSHLILIFRCDSTLCLSEIHGTMNYLQGVFDEETSLLFAAPIGDIPALTLIWS